MTIAEVAERLKACSNMACDECKHHYNKLGKREYADCQALLIAEMGSECVEIVERMEAEEQEAELTKLYYDTRL